MASTSKYSLLIRVWFSPLVARLLSIQNFDGITWFTVTYAEKIKALTDRNAGFEAAEGFWS